ncbi:F-box domain containing protein [Parasponia andersonii]|uniref:F-box domain containing protein n=1 Tax=Parasponia andersonii TaxID=3476 RepID=A0A2P5CSY1_PARAD|nr:F-box domain containing protein [Parasponia andersonii]
MPLLIHQITTDDLLVEIFIRLPDIRSVIRCGAVCKRWFSLITSIHFRRQKLLRHHSHQSLPFTFIIRHGWCAKLTVPLCEYFPKESLILHGGGLESSCGGGGGVVGGGTYLDFLPWRNVWLHSSCDDLLLLSLERGKQFMICNPFTKQWLQLPLPQTPVDLTPFDPFGLGHGGLVCKPNNRRQQQQLLKLDQYSYKVMLIWEIYTDVNTNVSDFRTITFCSETGKWSSALGSLPFPRELTYNPPVVCNGMLHWLTLDLDESTVHGILAFDPFKDAGHPEYLRSIEFPSGLVQEAGQSHQALVRLGLVCGRLRLSQLLVTQRNGFALKVWELNYDDGVNDGGDDHDGMWTLVHDIRVKSWTDDRLYVFAFHPYDGNVLFVLFDKRDIYQYDIGEEKMEQMGQLPNGGERTFPARLRNYTLVHPFWPTPIPDLPSL